MRDPRLYLKDILSAMDAIESFVEGVDFETFRNKDLNKAIIDVL